MEWEFVVALVIAIPIILFPAAFIWYMNLGGLIRVMREARAKERKTVAAAAKAK